MVLLMLSPVAKVKLSSSSEQDSDVHPQQGENSHRGMSSSDNLGSNHRPSEMSRRKQKNPKPFFTPSEDQDDDKSNDGKNNNNLDTSFTSSQSEDEDMTPIEDLSSLVKVEMEEGLSPAVEAAPQRSSRSRSPSPRSSSTPHPPNSIPFPPPPPLARQGDQIPLPYPKDIPNMFHFGDVKINHHPDTQPVPMVIPMVYLYPIQSTDQATHPVRYRMFVPIGAPIEPLPAFPAVCPPVLPDLSLQRQDVMALPTKSSQRSGEMSACTIPLDLRKSPGSRASSSPHPEDNVDPSRSSPSVLRRSPSDPQRFTDAAKQKEIEVQLQFLKAKQLEFLQTQQKQAAAALAVAKMSRCDECNINFSKYQNYVAHKKYYCSASAKSNPPPTSVQVASDNEDDDPLPGPAPKRLKIDTASLHSGTSSPLPLASTPSSAKPPTPSLTSPNSEAPPKEIKLVKPQDLLQEASQALLLPSGNLLNHFVCDGCGIKFKSVSNLQAHQARYCAGLRKPEELATLEVALKRSSQQKQRVSPQHMQLPLAAAEMMNFLNAKTLEQQLVAAATQAHFAAAITKEKGPASINSVMAAAMAGSSGISQNGIQADDYCCILCGYKEQSVERLKDHINLHFIGQIKRRPVAPSPSDKSPRTVSNGSSSTNGSTSEDHGQDPKYIKTEVAVNRTDSDETEDKSGDASPKPSAPLTSPTSASNVLPKVEQGLRCHSCDIGFSHLSNLVAHKKFYCRGLQAVAPGAERHSQ